MENDFTRAVEEGLKLAKRVYSGKDRHAAAPPKPALGMERSPSDLHPTAPTLYAVIVDPAIVDNPDIPSYQPHVYGRCDPPALIPLQMKEIAMEIDCYLDTAFVTVHGSWRVHCVMGNRSCDCRLVVPMGEQGSILGVEVDVATKSYSTLLIQTEDEQIMDKIPKNEYGSLLKPQLFSLTIPQVDGGSDISIKVSWSQKLLYKDSQFLISVPFNFPEYVSPVAKIFSKREKIQLNVNSGTGKEVLCQSSSHTLKEKRRDAGKMGFLYEAEVDNWSSKDFHFSYKVYSSDLFGGILLQSPSMHDFDQRDMFCLYLLPGNNQNRKVFRKEVVFIVDISGSMRGKPLENVKKALSTTLAELTPGDYFNIIAFNEDMYLFSSSLELATKDIVENATQWIDKTFVADGGTNIMNPLDEAMCLLSKTQDSLPHIFLITDGAVEDERNICCTVRSHVTNRGSLSPRISTFGIGSYCNHHFLRMLASIGRGQYDAAYDADSIEIRMQRWLRRASSPILANITVDTFDYLDRFEVYPFQIPDLLFGYPLIVSGRYQGTFPDFLKVRGSLADMSDFLIELKVQKMKDIPLDRVFAKQQIDLLTAQAWFSESKQLEEKVTKLSMQSGVLSEYTHMIFLQRETEKQDLVGQVRKIDLQKYVGSKDGTVTLVRGVTSGFGNVIATAENLPTGFGEVKLPETSNVFNKAASCCGRLANCCCCMCCIRMCSHMNDQCVIALTQLCTALSCFACFECCAELCCDSSD